MQDSSAAMNLPGVIWLRSSHVTKLALLYTLTGRLLGNGNHREHHARGELRLQEASSVRAVPGRLQVSCRRAADRPAMRQAPVACMRQRAKSTLTPNPL